MTTIEATLEILRSRPAAESTPTKMLWTGRVITTLTVAFLLFDAIMKVIKPRFVVEATVQLGYPESTIVGIGAALLVSTILYLVPRTSILGAILLTGYLGGAVASNVRILNPLFSNTLFPVYSACWSGAAWSCAIAGCAR
jgi:DoxX-like family